MAHERDSRKEFVLGTLAAASVAGLLLLGVVLGRALHRPSERDVEPETAHVAFDLDLDEPLEARRHDAEEYRRFLAEALARHSGEVESASTRLTERLGRFFDARRRAVPVFAERALTLRNRWRAATDSHAHREELKRLFEVNVLSADEVTVEVGAAVDEYVRHVGCEEERLLEALRTKLAALPALEGWTAVNEASFKALLQSKLDELASRMSKDSSDGGISFVLGGSAAAASFFILLPEVGPLSAAAASRVAFVAVALIGDFIGHLITALTMTEEEVAAAGERILVDLAADLTLGDEEARSDFESLHKLASKDPDQEMRRRAADLMQRMQASGHLGITTLLRHVEQRGMDMRSKALSEIITP